MGDTNSMLRRFAVKLGLFSAGISLLPNGSLSVAPAVPAEVEGRAEEELYEGRNLSGGRRFYQENSGARGRQVQQVTSGYLGAAGLSKSDKKLLLGANCGWISSRVLANGIRRGEWEWFPFECHVPLRLD